jgi:hypothetical protein
MVKGPVIEIKFLRRLSPLTGIQGRNNIQNFPVIPATGAASDGIWLNPEKRLEYEDLRFSVVFGALIDYLLRCLVVCIARSNEDL